MLTRCDLLWCCTTKGIIYIHTENIQRNIKDEQRRDYTAHYTFLNRSVFYWVRTCSEEEDPDDPCRWWASQLDLQKPGSIATERAGTLFFVGGLCPSSEAAPTRIYIKRYSDPDSDRSNLDLNSDKADLTSYLSPHTGLLELRRAIPWGKSPDIKQSPNQTRLLKRTHLFCLSAFYFNILVHVNASCVFFRQKLQSTKFTWLMSGYELSQLLNQSGVVQNNIKSTKKTHSQNFVVCWWSPVTSQFW